ncbi:phospholipase D family protein [Myxosarcina sp. GI1]|uniref:phospholipase D family protein n=1 Tax=Myxosarcina sp. GI1 TaxID=1541065 RepID=UPI000689CA31|nr:phospholipase D family protein [Myxosarcina sp. GI1]
MQKYQQEIVSPPKNIELKTPINPSHQFIIGKRSSRKAIEELINQAEEFLFISSYIIEDRSITELICQKAAILPQGVWILTDLNNEVVDAIDTQVEDIPSSREAYQPSDAKKAQCLKLLLAAGARIRGGAFHLKTYISETAAYLGSCNLTGGSLDFNLESGFICQGTTTHQNLWQYFIRCWEHKTKYDIVPLPSGFIQRTLNNSSPDSKFSSQTLLTPKQYREDLSWELSKGSEKVAIYSRNFSPDTEILSLLATRSTSVYADGFINNPNHRITAYLKSGVHAKVTLIGDRVAYLGGVNFQFSRRGFSLIDLMYKTCDRDEIMQIQRQLSVSSF